MDNAETEVAIDNTLVKHGSASGIATSSEVKRHDIRNVRNKIKQNDVGL